MRTLALSRDALCSLVAAALLAGCGGAQPPIAALGASPQSPAIAAHAARGGSWMLPEAKSEDLLYVSTSGGVSVFSYPRGKLEGSLAGLQEPFGICSDKTGHVFVVDQKTQTVEEYARGGTTPVATLNDYPNFPSDCSVDPNSGDLAVSGGIGHGLGPSANVAIFKGATGSPTLYTTEYAFAFTYCTYDDGGDIFVTAGTSGSGSLAELSSGSKSFKFITVDYFFSPGANVQWDGTHLVLAAPSGRFTGPQTMLQLKVVGSFAEIVKTFELSSGSGRKDLHADGEGFAVLGNTIIYEKETESQGSYGPENIGFWDYPAGGSVKKTIKIYGPQKSVISVAPR